MKPLAPLALLAALAAPAAAQVEWAGDATAGTLITHARSYTLVVVTPPEVVTPEVFSVAPDVLELVPEVASAVELEAPVLDVIGSVAEMFEPPLVGALVSAPESVVGPFGSVEGPPASEVIGLSLVAAPSGPQAASASVSSSRPPRPRSAMNQAGAGGGSERVTFIGIRVL